jgi:hypothetical protein
MVNNTEGLSNPESLALYFGILDGELA